MQAARWTGDTSAGTGDAMGVGRKPDPHSFRQFEHVRIGTGFELVQRPWKPNDWVPPGSTRPLYDMFVAVTIEPLWTRLAFQALVTRCPELGHVQATRHLLIVEAPLLRTMTSAVNPF